MLYKSQIYKKYDPFPLDIYNFAEEMNKINAVCGTHQLRRKNGSGHFSVIIQITEQVAFWSKKMNRVHKTPVIKMAQPVWRHKKCAVNVFEGEANGI